MKSYDALQKAIQGKTVDFARALGVSTSLVCKWQEPSTDFTDSGAYNPLDRIEAIIEKSLNIGHSHEDSLTPVFYLNERFNLITIDANLKSSKDGLSQDFFKTIKEFGDLAKETSEALKDGSLKPHEIKAIEKEGWETIRAIASFIFKAQEAGRDYGKNS